MITPSFGLTSTERVLPKLALDFTTAFLDSRVTFTRTTGAFNPATYVNNSGVVTLATDNQPRFDHDPLTLVCKGLLIEESRQNLCLYSEAFNTSPTWTATAATVSQNTVLTLSPKGTNTAAAITETTATSAHVVGQSALPLNTQICVSTFLKSNGRNFALVGNTVHAISVNLINGSVSSGVGTVTNLTSVNFGNGWYRVSYVATYSSNNALNIYTSQDGVFANRSFAGDDTKGIFVFGTQIEAGAFATSYIPTTTTALTRNADVATMTGTNFSDWYNPSEGTFVATVIPSVTATTTMGVLSTSDGTNTKTMDIRFQGGKAYGASVDTSVQALIDTGSFSQDVSTTIGFAYKVNSYAAAKDGASPGVDNSGTVPSQNTMRIGNLTATLPNYGRQHIQQIMYYPQRCVNAEVQMFSK